MLIRYATEADINAVLLIEQQGGGDWKREFFIDEIGKKFSMFLVAEIEQEIAGFAVIWFIAGEIQLHNISVSEKYRRQKIGSYLLKYIENYSYAEKPQSIQLEVREKNMRARAFYEANGFDITGLRPNYYKNDNAVLMEKILNSAK